MELLTTTVLSFIFINAVCLIGQVLTIFFWCLLAHPKRRKKQKIEQWLLSIIFVSKCLCLEPWETRLTRRVSLVEQELLILPEHLRSPPNFSGVRVTRSLVLYVCFVDRCLSFCTFSFGHCVVCSSSIYGFWLPLWYLQTLLVPSYETNQSKVVLRFWLLTYFEANTYRTAIKALFLYFNLCLV